MREGATLEWMAGLVADCYRPRPEYSVWQWAEKHVFLDAKASATPRFYDSSLTPWTRRYQELLLDPEVDEIFVMKSSQSGYTEASLNCLRFMPTHCPGNALYAINSRDEARDVSRRRLRGTLQQAAADQFSGDEQDVTTHRISLRNMEIVVTGSGAAGPFMQTWYRVAILDELEEHDATDDTTTTDRTRSRFTTVPDSKLFGLSKPKRTGGPIHAEFLGGTCEEWEVPCPECGQLQALVWERVRFDHCRDLAGDLDPQRLENEVFYECAHCEARIPESAKRAMNEGGRWVPWAPERREAPLVPRRVSMHISDLVSPFPKVSWARLAMLYWESKGNIVKRRHFINNHLGLPWEERAATVRDADLMRLRGGAPDPATGEPVGERFDWVWRDQKLVGEIPFRPALVSITVDKQQACLKYLVYAWNGRGESWLIEFGSLLDEAELLQLRDREYPVAGRPDEPAHIDTGLFDSGYRPNEVYAACIASDFWLYPSMGVGGVYGGKTVRASKAFHDGQHFVRYDYSDHNLKSEFYLSKVQKMGEPRLWLPWELPPEFVAEFSAERLVKSETKSGYTRFEWQKTAHQANDFGDCAKMQVMLWHIIGQEVMAQAQAVEDEEEKTAAAEIDTPGGRGGDGES